MAVFVTCRRVWKTRSPSVVAQLPPPCALGRTELGPCAERALGSLPGAAPSSALRGVPRGSPARAFGRELQTGLARGERSRLGALLCLVCEARSLVGLNY